MIILDQTIVNVALPSIQRDLGFSQSSLAWVVNAYLIPFGGVLLLAGRLGDLLGRKRILSSGLVVFTASSLLCGVAGNQQVLIAARFLEGVGGAIASALILGMIVAMFPEPHEQARAIGVYSFVAAAGGSIGLLAGGLLTQAISWHWIFFVNLPIGIAASVLAHRWLESEPGIGLAHGADALGATLVTSALMLGVYTIVGEAADNGWTSSRTLVFGAIALLLLVGFVVREATHPRPLLPLRVFKSRDVSGANLVQALMVAGMFGLFFLGSLYMQRVLRYDALQIGLAFLPVALAVGTLSVDISPRLCNRFGARPVLLWGLTFTLAGLALFARAPLDADYVRDILPEMVLLGVGGGLFASGAHDAGDVRRLNAGCGTRLGSGEHQRSGWRRAWPGGAGNGFDSPERGIAGCWSKPRFGAAGRLSPGVRYQRRSGPGQYCACRDGSTPHVAAYAGGSRSPESRRPRSG